jgi:hypothetical protein
MQELKECKLCGNESTERRELERIFIHLIDNVLEQEVVRPAEVSEPDKQVR